MHSFFSEERIYILDSIDSTNNYARTKLRESLTGPIAIIAREQTKGKGLASNTWLSEKNKNLTLSVVLNPEQYHIKNPFLLNKITALCVRDFIIKYTNNAEKVLIKWPNDILVDREKISGILIENTLSANKFLHTVIGVGININQDTFPEALPNPTSLKLITKKNHAINLLIPVWLNCFEKWLHELTRCAYTNIHSAYLSALFQYNQPAKYKYGTKEIEATITNVDAYGRLCLKTIKGESLCCDMKEISFMNYYS